MYLRRNQVDVLKELPDKIEVEDWFEPTVKDLQHLGSASTGTSWPCARQATPPPRRAAIGPLTGAMLTARRREPVGHVHQPAGPCVLVSQIEAGAVGQNIQVASVMIITEPQWKPSTEIQPITWAHRMGQVDTVLVHRLLAKNTVDQRIRELP